MSELINKFRQTFNDEEYRNAYAEGFLNSYVAAQIKVLREDFPLTQGELAAKIGTQQPGIARLENVNYSAWKVETLRKLARALQVRLKITFEEFGTLSDDVEEFNKAALKRSPFQRDPAFLPSLTSAAGIDNPCIAAANPSLGNVEVVMDEQEKDPTRRFQPQPELGSLYGKSLAAGAAGQI